MSPDGLTAWARSQFFEHVGVSVAGSTITERTYSTFRAEAPDKNIRRDKTVA